MRKPQGDQCEVRVHGSPCGPTASPVTPDLAELLNRRCEQGNGASTIHGALQVNPTPLILVEHHFLRRETI